MSITFPIRPAKLAALCLAAGLLAVGATGAKASNTGGNAMLNDPADWLLRQAEALTPGGGMTTTAQSSASAWSQSNGDHGMTVTTTRSGDVTSCMVIEWKRENGAIRKWQYRCDAQP